MNGFNEKLISAGEVIAVALSGGEDSVCLLHLLKEIEPSVGFRLVAVNVEHGIRGEASLKDSAFVKSLCEKLSVPVKMYTVCATEYALKNKLSLEEAARKLRYDCFFDAVESGFCDKIACAHHSDDNMETILFNIFRGTSVSGLKGMDEVSYGGRIIRPLLHVGKQEISQYVKEHGLSYVTDETNSDTTYTRNYIRGVIIPAIIEKFPSAASATARLSSSAKSDDEYLYEIAKNAVVEKDGAYYIPCSLPYPVFSRAAVLALKGCGIKKDFDNRHIDALFGLTTNISGKKADLLGGVSAVREHDCVVVKKTDLSNKSAYKSVFVPFKEDVSVIYDKTVTVKRLVDKAVCEEVKKQRKNDTCIGNPRIFTPIANYFDLDKIPDGSVIRTRRVGDVFTKFGGGTVSLKKFLTDKKIPAGLKDELLLVAAGNVVYMVIGVEISDLVRIDDSTTAAAVLTLTLTADKKDK